VEMHEFNHEKLMSSVRCIYQYTEK
jgi:hypothetical protein